MTDLIAPDPLPPTRIRRRLGRAPRPAAAGPTRTWWTDLGEDPS